MNSWKVRNVYVVQSQDILAVLFSSVHVRKWTQLLSGGSQYPQRFVYVCCLVLCDHRRPREWVEVLEWVTGHPAWRKQAIGYYTEPVTCARACVWSRLCVCVYVTVSLIDVHKYVRVSVCLQPLQILRKITGECSDSLSPAHVFHLMHLNGFRHRF